LRFQIAATAGFPLLQTALKLPSVTGSSSHPAEVELAAILFAPRLVPALAVAVLLLQALLLAHGGLTTRGANVFAPGIAVPFAACGIRHAAQACAKLLPRALERTRRVETSLVFRAG
jgi:cobalt/nickel transport system permease protein